MKAVIPLAGKGTRLRPHTHLIPKPLMRVAGKPILDCILDDLLAAGVSEVVFIVGHLQGAVRAHLSDHELLFEGIERTMASGPGPKGEYYLTDAFQYMIDAGAVIETAPVAAWHDAGKVDAVLDANRHLLGRGRAGVAREARVRDSEVARLARIEAGAVVAGSRIGDNVTVEAGARIEDSELRDTIVGRGAVVEGSRLRASLVGGGAVVRGFHGTLNVSNHSEVLSPGDGPWQS